VDKGVEMASTDVTREPVQAGSDQRYPGTWAQPAQSALVLDTPDDPVVQPRAIGGVLDPIGATIEPLATLDRGEAVAMFPDRAFAGPNGAAFAGKVDAHAVRWATDFNLDRDLEGTAAPAGVRESAALGVASFAAEETGPAAALPDPPDGYWPGPGPRWPLSQGGRHLRPDGVLVRTTPDEQRVQCGDLDNADSNPLRDAVRLSGAETEAGTGVGTGVGGGGR
jgi:hypothetical protein